jgi:hypothetical protein
MAIGPGPTATGPGFMTTGGGAFYLEKFREILGSSEGILRVVLSQVVDYPPHT